jgi:hypothetical protein
MSNDDHDESIATIAARRLAAPGVVDREPVLRLYDRLQHPLPTSALADRLHQRAAHAEHADASSLVWQRTSFAANAFMPAPPPTPYIGHATTPSVRQPPPVQRSLTAAPVATATAPTLVQRLAERQHAPGVVTVAERIANSTSESPAVATDTLSRPVQKRYGLETATSPSVIRTATPTTASSVPALVMRKADSTDTRSMQQTPLASVVSRSSNPTLPAATASTSMPMSIARKHDASTAPSSSISGEPSRSAVASSRAISAIASAPSAPVIALASSAPSTASPLVLRRVAAPVPASPSMPPTPYVMPSSSAVADELTRAAHAEGAVSAPHAAAGATAHGSNPDIGRLAEEVERRLRLRLEIERERRGIRSWR